MRSPCSEKHLAPSRGGRDSLPPPAATAALLPPARGSSPRSERRLLEPLHFLERAFGELFLLLLLVLETDAQLFDETEVRVHRLEVLGVRLAQIAIERAEHRRRRRNDRLVT